MEHIEYNAKLKIKKNGFWDINSEKKAIFLYEKEIRKKYTEYNSQYERISFLTKEHIYDENILLFGKENIIKLDKYSKLFSFSFGTYISIRKFYEHYASWSRDGNSLYESYKDRVFVISIIISGNSLSLAKKFFKDIIEGRIQPSTPIFQDVGIKNRKSGISCSLFNMEDNLKDLTKNIENALKVTKIGASFSLNISNIRSRCSEIDGIAGASSGIVPVMKLFENIISFSNNPRQRRSAAAVFLSIFHNDIEEFLESKKINADEKNRVQMLSLGVIIPDIFFELAKKNENIFLFCPHEIKKFYNKNFSDIDFNIEYNTFKNDDRLSKKTFSSRKLMNKISAIQMESGFPYLIFLDNAKRQNPLKNIGKITMSNLCTEIFQSENFPIKNKSNGYINSPGCTLSSINITKSIAVLKETVNNIMDFLTNVNLICSNKNLESINMTIKTNNPVGVGILDLYGFMLRENIKYGSKESIELVNVLFSMINYHSLNYSVEKSKVTGIVFNDYKKSSYYNGEYFDYYIKNNNINISLKISKMFNEKEIPTLKDWEVLKKKCKKFGVYHSYRMAIPPNQWTSYISNSTPSIFSTTSQVETRVYDNLISYVLTSGLNKKNMIKYESAYEIDQYKMIDLVSEVQKHVDQGISMPLFIDSEFSTRDLSKLHIYAYKKNLKSIYYVRVKNNKINL